MESVYSQSVPLRRDFVAGGGVRSISPLVAISRSVESEMAPLMAAHALVTSMDLYREIFTVNIVGWEDAVVLVRVDPAIAQRPGRHQMPYPCTSA